MVGYNTLSAKLSDSQLNKLKSAVKNKEETTLRMNTLRELIFARIIFANFANFGQFCENFFREKSKIDQFVKISSCKISTFPSFAKINSVLKFAKNAIFWLFLIPRFIREDFFYTIKEYNESIKFKCFFFPCNTIYSIINQLQLSHLFLCFYLGSCCSLPGV